MTACNSNRYFFSKQNDIFIELRRILGMNLFFSFAQASWFSGYQINERKKATENESTGRQMFQF